MSKYNKCKNWDEVARLHPGIQGYEPEWQNQFVRIDCKQGYGSDEFSGSKTDYTITEHAWWSDEVERTGTEKQKLKDALRNHVFFIFKVSDPDLEL